MKEAIETRVLLLRHLASGAGWRLFFEPSCEEAGTEYRQPGRALEVGGGKRDPGKDEGDQQGGR